jgi:2-oxoglutarate ferredoxin oxidoreductase subunit gamma
MPNHYEIRFSGSGGQGMMLLGDIFAEAVGSYENKEIILTKSYGPESRGGACRSELIIDDAPINYPEAQCLDLLLAMTQQACDKYYGDLGVEGILLVDPAFVSFQRVAGKVYSIPMTEIAQKVTGGDIAANVVAMGAITVLGGFVQVESVRKTIAQRFHPSFYKVNQKAFNAGLDVARALSGQKSN